MAMARSGLFVIIALLLTGLDAGPNTELIPVTVIDGDTVVTQSGQRIRLLGINAPEAGGPYREREPLGGRAKAYLKKLTGHGVVLEVGMPKRDKYGRLLAHLFDVQGRHINRQMVASGLAHVSVVPPNTAYTGSLLAAENQATSAKKGIWSHPHYRVRRLNEASYQRQGWQRIKLKVKDYHYSPNGWHRLIVDERTELRVPQESVHYFDNLSAYSGKELEVRGWLSMRSGRASMLIRHPSAIIELEWLCMIVSVRNKNARAVARAVSLRVNCSV